MVKKVVETAYCDVDYAQTGKAEIRAEHENVVILGEPYDLCDTCLENITKALDTYLDLTPGPAPGPDAALTAELKPAQTADTLPQQGTDEWFAAMRAFADAQKPPIRYLYGKENKAVYSAKLKRMFAANQAQLRAASSR